MRQEQNKCSAGCFIPHWCCRQRAIPFTVQLLEVISCWISFQLHFFLLVELHPSRYHLLNSCLICVGQVYLFCLWHENCCFFFSHPGFSVEVNPLPISVTALWGLTSHIRFFWFTSTLDLIKTMHQSRFLLIITVRAYGNTVIMRPKSIWLKNNF